MATRYNNEPSPSSYSSQTDKHILQFVYDLMSKYKELETESTSNIIYSCHNEFDSNNVCEFEGLSNGNYIVVKTKLNPIHMPEIMRMFQSIYEDNYWSYEELNHECYSCDMFLMEMYNEEEEKTREIRDKLLKYDVDEWFKLLVSHSEKHNKLEFNEKEEIYYVDEEKIFYEPPRKEYYEEDIYEETDEETDENDEKNYYTQKFYTLDDILEMLENDMKTTLRPASRNLK